ncbi:hypothetical protein [Flocculibacter collagenilyticus]|uniref:hypothetical protein n=1 Tax=Flocculibacter collagenilyticus TaxID=2744479 RepID=UPI0018F45276|nr:hypothetical protein [Flocculibacter collagenilyticus]
MSKVAILFTTGILAFSVSLSGCSTAEPVAKERCDEVVKHSKKILGDNAPSNSELLKQCKAATDEQRGCAMAADKPMKLLKCM